MQKKKKAALTLAVLVALVSCGTEPGSAAVQQDAEHAVQQAVQAGTKVSGEKAQELAHSTLHVTALEVPSGSALTKEKILKLVPELGKSDIDVARLGRQIALYNTNGNALKLAVNFQQVSGGYKVRAAGVKGERVEAGLFVSNNGSTYTGDWRGTLTYVDRNLSGRGDTLGAAVVNALDKPDAVHEGAISYTLPLPHAADTLTLQGSASDSKLHDLAKGYPFDITASGKSERVRLAYQHYLAHAVHETDAWEFGVDYHHTDNDTAVTLDRTYPLAHYDLRHVDAALGFRHADAGRTHRFGYALGVQRNVLGDRQDFRQMTGDAAKHFTVFHGSANYHKRLPQDWLLSFRTAGQYTDDSLIGCEKFGAGGQDSVRGFDENIRTADRGISGSLECYTPRFLKGVRALAFVDGAALRNNGTGVDHTDLASCGLGLRFHQQDLYLSLDYAFILHEPDSVERDPAGHRRFSFFGGITF